MQPSGVIDGGSQRHSRGLGVCGAQGAMRGNVSGCCAAAAPSSSTCDRRHQALRHLTASNSGVGSACILLQAIGVWSSYLTWRYSALDTALVYHQPRECCPAGGVMQAIRIYA